jgi:hypothetical protein
VDPLYGDACSAKSFEVLHLIFITDCSPIDWLQSVLTIRSFENLLLSFLKTGTFDQPELFDPKLTRHFLQYAQNTRI